jgi:hypothetical protein
MAVIGAHQVRLRSTAHPPYVLDSFHRHGGILAFSRPHSAKPIYRKEREGRKGTRNTSIAPSLRPLRPWRLSSRAEY